jgi:hypothetical protein
MPGLWFRKHPFRDDDLTAGWHRSYNPNSPAFAYSTLQQRFHNCSGGNFYKIPAKFADPVAV